MFLAHGLDVCVTDPAPGAEQRLRSFVERTRPAPVADGRHATARSSGRLQFAASLAAAVRDADFVQECAPERFDFKQQLFSELDAIVPPTVVLASSSSGLVMSKLQSDCRHPERCVIGHPFNPPHLIPLVELVGGNQTSPHFLDVADRFYTRLGKRVIRLHKEVPGHVANRLQAALWREAVHLVAEGVVSVADVDAAVCWGPGLRWGLMGPNLVFHLGGGEGGITHFLEHLSGPFSDWWADLGDPKLTPELRKKIVDGVHAEAAGRSIEALAQQRDDFLVQLLAIRRSAAASSLQ